MISPELAQQIALLLASRHSVPVAFIADGETIYYSAGVDPVTELIQAVYDHHSGQARRILRARIFSTTPLSQTALGMLKIAAKRATAPVEGRDHQLAIRTAFHRLSSVAPPALIKEVDLSDACLSHLRGGEPMRAAFALAEEIEKRQERFESDRKVAALLLDASGKLIAASKNANAKNRTRHAEINLIQGLLVERGARIPRGARLYVTLKCCKMCAAAIADTAEDIRTNRVYYGANDPGPGARATALDRLAEVQSPYPIV